MATIGNNRKKNLCGIVRSPRNCVETVSSQNLCGNCAGGCHLPNHPNVVCWIKRVQRRAIMENNAKPDPRLTVPPACG
jgi:hypothetical protein